VHRRIHSVVMLVLLLAGVPAMCLADEILRDPTRPYVPYLRGSAAAPRFEVNAIIVSPKRKVAIVNGRRVGIGESVDGATIIAIEQKELVLEQDGKRITVALSK